LNPGKVVKKIVLELISKHVKDKRRCNSRGQYRGQYYLIFSLMTWMMGRSAPSASLQIRQNWEEWLVHQLFLLSFKKTFTDCRNGLTRISRSFAKGITVFCTWEGTTSCTHIWVEGLKEAWQRRIWGSWWTPS